MYAYSTYYPIQYANGSVFKQCEMPPLCTETFSDGWWYSFGVVMNVTDDWHAQPIIIIMIIM